ncbi:MAG TPA: hypothetical protein VGC76_10565 [Pyrinomonadaceae bacterium]
MSNNRWLASLTSTGFAIKCGDSAAVGRVFFAPQPFDKSSIKGFLGA